MADEAREVPSRTTKIDRRQQAMGSPRVRRRQRIALAFIGIALLIILGVLAAGYVFIFVLPPRELVIGVNDVKYTRGDLVKLVRVRQKSLEFFEQQFDVSADIFQGLQILVENEIITQSAPGLGITVSESELDTQIREIMVPAHGAFAGQEPDQIEREFQEIYKSYLNTIQISEREHRQLVRRATLREKFRQYVGDTVPTVAEQVHLYRIVMRPNDELDIMQIRFKDAVGDNTTPEELHAAYKHIVREFSVDSAETVRRGGDLGWVPKGIFESYENWFFDLEVGKLSDPASNTDNAEETFFFMISERSPAREIDAQNLNELKTGALQDWLNRNRSEHDVTAKINSEIFDWIIQQMRLTANATPTPEPLDFFNQGP